MLSRNFSLALQGNLQTLPLFCGALIASKEVMQGCGSGSGLTASASARLASAGCLPGTLARTGVDACTQSLDPLPGLGFTGVETSIPHRDLQIFPSKNGFSFCHKNAGPLFFHSSLPATQLSRQPQAPWGLCLDHLSLQSLEGERGFSRGA